MRALIKGLPKKFAVRLRAVRLRTARLGTARLRTEGEAGAATAEYAIVIMAAVGFAGLLVVIMRSDEVRGILTDLIQRALTFAG